MPEILKTNLFLFDGEAAGTAGDNENTGAQGEVGGTPTIDNPNIPLHLLKNIPDELKENAGIGSDTKDAAEEGEAAKSAEPTYEEIKERYKEDFKKDVETQINRRFKSANKELDGLKKSNAAMQAVLDLVGNSYPGVDAKNPEALLMAMKNDERFFRQKAIDNGTSIAEEQFNFEKEAELQETTRRLAQITQDQEKARTFAELNKQSEKLKGTYPDFDLGEALENESFRMMLAFTKNAKGVENVKEAYEFAFRDQLREKAIEQTVTKTKEAISQNRKAKQYMPSPPGNTGKSVNPNTNLMEQIGVKEFAKLASRGNLIDYLK